MRDDDEQMPDNPEPVDTRTRHRRRFLGMSAAGGALAVFYPRAGIAASNGSVTPSAACSQMGTDPKCTMGIPAKEWEHSVPWHRWYKPDAIFDRVFATALTIKHGVFGDHMTIYDVLRQRRAFGGGARTAIADASTQAAATGNGKRKQNGAGGGPPSQLLPRGRGLVHPGYLAKFKSSNRKHSSSSAQARDEVIGLEDDVSQLGREAVAALQNAGTVVPYPLSEAHVIDEVAAALAKFDLHKVKETTRYLRGLNEDSSPSERTRMLEMLDA
jgi:hypothetical protein